jgi:hypothetical protein
MPMEDAEAAVGDEDMRGGKLGEATVVAELPNGQEGMGSKQRKNMGSPGAGGKMGEGESGRVGAGNRSTIRKLDTHRGGTGLRSGAGAVSDV